MWRQTFHKLTLKNSNGFKDGEVDIALAAPKVGSG